MKLSPTTSLNDAVKRVASSDIGAASVIAMLVRDHPDTSLGWLREMDRISMYGHDIWINFVGCNQNIKEFLKALGDGRLERVMSDLKRSRGIK